MKPQRCCDAAACCLVKRFDALNNFYNFANLENAAFFVVFLDVCSALCYFVVVLSFFSFYKKFSLCLTFTYHRPMNFVFEKFIWFFNYVSRQNPHALKASGFPWLYFSMEILKHTIL